MEQTVDTAEYNIEVTIDEFASDPREMSDHLGTMVCFHGRYNLGDKHGLSIEEAKELSAQEDVISLPLYLYDHSGITMSTTPFSCPWDSGQVGFIYAKKNAEGLSDDSIRETLEAEVKEYDSYLTGEVYRIDIFDIETGELIDCCSGIMEDDIQSHIDQWR